MTGTNPAPPALEDRTALPFSRLAYSFPPGFHDESRTSAHQIRPHWQTFFNELDTLGFDELLRRWQEARQLIRENGVTYNVYGDPRGLDRPWELDPLPLLISAEESRFIEEGLTQRARLLERILSDVYGPQTLLATAMLPPELLYGNPGFLRPCHGLLGTNQRRLLHYAADLARSADGALWVLSDRTQAPSGAGYALENRIVLARMLPEVFRECRVQRLALFFRSLRETLAGIAPHHRDNPRIVLLTPGPNDETYFEHAYLARYLGLTLAEGGDLTVRDNRVYLKLLGGLQSVDVIFRRLGDDFCDPLELRGDSFLGVPGLVQAVRAGNVAIANALGSGLAETPALAPFLPGLCRHLLGEELKLPSTPAWWCGQPQALEHVLAHLPRMVIKPSFRSQRFDPIFGEKLSGKQRQELADKIRARPRLYVGQEQMALSTTPLLVDGRLEARHVVIRYFLAATETNQYTMMPGGLTRVTSTPDSLVVSMQQGGRSKDTWVLASGPVSTFSLLRASVQAVELSRGGGDLPSRAADNLFWLGRYVERAEGCARLLRAILVRLTEKSGLADVPELPTLLKALTRQSQTLPGFIGEGAALRLADPEPELLSLIFDRDRRGSLASTLGNIQRVAGMARDRISTDMWRILSGLSLEEGFALEPRAAERGRLDFTNPETRPTLSDVLDLLNRWVISLAAFSGMAAESMTRGQAWRFLDIGRRLERTFHLTSLLRTTLSRATGTDGLLLEALLEITDSSMTYRRRYLSNLQPAPVLDLILADEANRRSLAYQLVELADDVDHLPRGTQHPNRSPEQRVMLATLTLVRMAEIDPMARADALGARPQLDELLTRLEAELPVFADAITRKYLSHLQASRQLATGQAGADA